VAVEAQEVWVLAVNLLNLDVIATSRKCIRLTWSLMHLEFLGEIYRSVGDRANTK
jgi:hypothetical protein